MSGDDSTRTRTALTASSLGAETHAAASLPETAESELNEDRALALLKQNDLAGEVLERLSKNSGLMRSRMLKLALVQHPKTPRSVSISLVRHLFTFDLMRVALAPAVAGDIRAIADDTLTRRVETISSGERQTLARRGSGRIAAVLLQDSESRVVQAALENPRLTEAGVIKALVRANPSQTLAHAVCHHPRWSVRREVRVALLRNLHTPMARALEFARSLPSGTAKDILHGSQLPPRIKEYLLKDLG